MAKRIARPTHTNGVTEALSYTRVSSDEQEREGVSLDAQLAACRRYAAEHGWAIGEEYTDVLTGKRDDRPDYQRLLTDIRRLRAQGRQLVVVVAWLHRFGRRVLERVRSREELKTLGVSLHSAREGGEVSDLVANILASVAEEETRQLAERVSEAIQYIRENGWHPVGRAPWGYLWRDATADERAMGAPIKVLDVDEVAAPYVREAFQRVATGASVRSVGRWLCDLPNDVRGGRHFNLYAVRKLLRAGVYISRHGGGAAADVLSSPRGRWPALISDALWLRASEQIDNHRHTPHQASGKYVLTGIIRCPACGARMVGLAHSNRSRSPRYRCDGYSRGAAAPDARCTVTASAPTLEADVLERVGEMVAWLSAEDPRVQQALKRAWAELQKPTDRPDVSARLKRLEADRRKAERRLAAAAIKLVDDHLDKAGYDAAKASIAADLKALDKETAALASEAGVTTEPLPALDYVLQALDGWTAAVRDFDLIAQRALLGYLIDYVEPIRVGHGKYQARIHWKRTGEALQRVTHRLTAVAA
ncbi:MAG: recombinase family protein [Chloroflexi bacterium]|nr:recombinase family protein [Chloroflexota bacterium]